MPATLQEVVPACPLCKGSSSLPFDRRSLHGFDLINRICQSCGLVFLSPRMSADQLTEFYAQNYRMLYHDVKEPTPADLAVQTRRAGFLADLIKGQGVTRLGRHLDIGCSTGTLLSTFNSVFNSQPVGIELDDSHRAYAQAHGLSVYPTLSELPQSFEKQFDLISLSHVLEHLPDPVGTLAELNNRWMRPDGWLLLEVPNLYCHDSFEVAHLVSFSPTTLARAVRQSGFRVVRLIKHGQPRSDILPLYITLLARPETPADIKLQTEPEFLVRLQRQAGLANRRLLTRLMPGKAWKAVNH